MRFCLHIMLIASTLTARAQERRDTVPDTPMSDTLKTVVVTEDGRLPIHVSDAAKERISTKSMSDILGESVTDKMMHPFAISQRKKERHKRKMDRILREYDMIKTDHDLLIEALLREGINVDSLMNAHKALKE